MYTFAPVVGSTSYSDADDFYCTNSGLVLSEFVFYPVRANGVPSLSLAMAKIMSSLDLIFVPVLGGTFESLICFATSTSLIYETIVPDMLVCL